jgi:hypothetical protein
VGTRWQELLFLLQRSYSQENSNRSVIIKNNKLQFIFCGTAPTEIHKKLPLMYSEKCLMCVTALKCYKIYTEIKQQFRTMLDRMSHSYCRRYGSNGSSRQADAGNISEVV